MDARNCCGGSSSRSGKRFGRRDPYDYGGPAGVAATTDLTSLKLESQAQIIQELWRARHGASVDRLENAFTSTYVEDLQRLVDGAGIGTRPPVAGRSRPRSTGSSRPSSTSSSTDSADVDLPVPYSFQVRCGWFTCLTSVRFKNVVWIHATVPRIAHAISSKT